MFDNVLLPLDITCLGLFVKLNMNVLYFIGM